jgi:hypothetical protein
LSYSGELAPEMSFERGDDQGAKKIFWFFLREEGTRRPGDE